MTGMDSAAKARLETLLKEGLAKASSRPESSNVRPLARSQKLLHALSNTDASQWLGAPGHDNDTPLDDVLEADATEALSALGSYLARASTIHMSE